MKTFKQHAVTAAVLGLMWLAAAGAHAATVSITDVNPLDANVITGQSFAGSTLTVTENYGEHYTVPYASHDGNAVVDKDHQYFDKTVTITNWAPNQNLTFQFEVKNLTPWEWSDYHFEIWNTSFTQRLANFPITQASSDIFTNQSIDTSTIAAFWAPGWQQVGQTGIYTLTIDPTTLLSPLGNETFGIRQVATVPEPEGYSLALIGFGVVGWAARRRKA